MIIVSYNVNGIRAAVKNGLIEWLRQNPCDVLCLQEVKALPEQVDFTLFQELGYEMVAWNAAEKKGYSGVAVFTRNLSPDLVTMGMNVPFFDSEGRIARVDFGDWTLLNCYFPSGTSGEVRQTAKMQFLDYIDEYAHKLVLERPKLIICGDYNIANTEIDIHDPKGNKNSSGFLPEERAWLTKWFRSGFTDAFRFIYPEKIEYSWWTYRANARNNNKGWRIDYFSVSAALENAITDCRQINTAIHSDHCPVWLDIDLPE